MNELGIKGKVLWSGTMEYLEINEETLMKAGMSRKEARKLLLDMVNEFGEKNDKNNKTRY